MKKTKASLLHSGIALLLCISMFIGSTFAWFSDSVFSGKNIITAGNLDLEMYWTDDLDSGEWNNVEENGHNTIFNYDNWEPGYTDVKYIKLVNAGDLALNYKLSLTPQNGVGKLAEVINVYFAEGGVAVEQRSDLQSLRSIGLLDNVLNGGATADGTLLSADQYSPLHPSGEVVMTVAMNMLTTAGNEYQNEDAGEFSITALATQAPFETDSFGSDYDSNAKYPAVLNSDSASATVNPVNGKVPAGGVALTGGNISAFVPEGVVLENGTTKLTLTVTPLKNTTSDITVVNGEILIPMDVHIDGVAEGNTVPIIVDLGEVLPKYLNMGNYHLYHVENGANSVMTLVADASALTAHNTFTYDPLTGEVSVAMASFSEVTVVADTTAKWDGNEDDSWYDLNATELQIANADQLYSFAKIVGGMADGTTQDSFKNKTVKLLSDINLNHGTVVDDGIKRIFYPVGYYNTDNGVYTDKDKYDDKTNIAISSGFKTFEGTFDGNGHTISNIYQNTWEMKGDHDWYAAEDQHYRDGMGIFGRVYGGTIKNLTVDNFESDGEITTTGVIASYADFGATFENIAITNCNPRVYNIGNGGIVGCVGWYTKGVTDKKVTFKNITVDNSNKISALWGSYDVPCGGIVGQYYPTSGQTSAGTPKNAGIHFENCHVSAVMDVYNDVCANYQYYAYRYAGMIIGSIRENETINGHVYPKMDGITAKGCTVHYDTWNDYYYCELVANSLASYTHDHQFSRLEQVSKVEGTTITPLKGNAFTVPTSGRYNYVVVNGEFTTENATCYHFVDGEVWNHADAGKETVNGVEVLKEDKQHIYLPFAQLFTGYGWGVTSRGIEDFAGIDTMDITQSQQKESVEKFASKADIDLSSIKDGNSVSIADLFVAIKNAGVEIKDETVMVAVTDLTKTGITADFTRGASWDQGTLKFNGTNGYVKITIQDYYFCKPTSVIVKVGDFKTTDRFKVAFPNKDNLNKVGNSGTVALGKLFTADGDIGENVTIDFEPVIGASVDKTTINATKETWAAQTVEFSDTGIVKVTIIDNNFSTRVTQYLEVVEAENVTKATDATSKNIVLLNDISGGFTVSGNHTFYGNGFTLNYTGNGQYLNNGLKQGLVTVSENGTLDNLRIKASIYPNAYMYYGATMLGEYVQAGPSSVEGDKTRYHYQLSSIVAKGSATISNCYIYGGRTNIFVDTGNVAIKDTVLESGAVANVQIQSTSEYTVTLENVTTIQQKVNATIGDTSEVLLGAGVLVGPDTTSNPKIVLNGTFKQYNWVNADDKEAVTKETAKMIIGGALDATNFNHTVNGKTASNLGIIYMNTEKVVVENNTGLPYEEADVTMNYNGVNANGKAYSLQNAEADQIYIDNVNADRTTKQGDYLPTFNFDLGSQAISYDGSEDTRYLYGDANGVTALYQDGEAALTLDLSKIATIYKYTGLDYTYSAVCKDSSGNKLTATNGVVTLSKQDDYTLEFTVSDNLFYDKNGVTIDKSVERTFTVPLKLTVKAASIKNAVVNITKTALDGEYNTVNLTDYELRIKFLDCISVTDYDNKGTGTTVTLSSNISSATLTPAGVNVFTTASTITITYTDGRVLTVNLSKISGSSPGTKTAKVNTSGSVYFTTEGALNNKPTEASSQNKCTITSVSYKGNSGSTVTNDTDVTVTWELGSSSSGGGGCVTGDTLVTLADGSKKKAKDVTAADVLLVWDFYNGKYAKVPAAVMINHGEGFWDVIELMFDDGTVVNAVTAHAFFDTGLNKTVLITPENAKDFIGHSFAKASDSGCTSVKLVDCNVVNKYTDSYSLVSAIHYNFIVEDIISYTNLVPDLFAGLEVGDNMKYDEEALKADVEKYGLYTHKDFAKYITEEQFNALNGAYMKISVGKGYVTYEEIVELIINFVK